MCAGGGGFKPVGYPTHELTGDGHVMAYRAGAAITGKEFLSPHHTDPETPAWPPMYLFFLSGDSAALPGMWRDERMVNADGDEVSLRGMAWHGWIDAEWEAHEGRAPVVMESRKDGAERPISGPGGHGSMLGHAAGGIVPADDLCATHVPGLYAAGDSCGTCFVGAAYSGFGFATMHAAVTGARAGLGAAAYALRADDPAPDASSVAGATERLLAPLRRRGGFSPRWTTQVLQNALAPYFVLYVKKDDRLRAALSTVEFLRDQVVPKLYARDDHELRLAHETASMVTNAEMKLRASLFRTESRGTHFREDYPHRDDGWLAWVRLKDEAGVMTPFTEQVPRDGGIPPWPTRSDIRCGCPAKRRQPHPATQPPPGRSDDGDRVHRRSPLQRVRHLRQALSRGRDPARQSGEEGAHPLSRRVHAVRSVSRLPRERGPARARVRPRHSAGWG